ncbi:EAL domain-containing protein [Trinickia sp. LjRoot230]|uniref:sensor domain-containing phosphodiesterase n=1 Tax=Trinickia sp. LjRoot230 TaxID=3342288 RepID=UPI003ED04A38
MASKRELTLSDILPHLKLDDTGWYIDYQGVTLRSAFQPVVSITHKRVVGYEALLRATDSIGQPIHPHTLFASAPGKNIALALERLTRCVHFANFAQAGLDQGWLFVNALPRLFRSGWPYGTFIDELCAHFELPHRRVVIELLEEPATDEALFERTVAALRERELLIAIDDFGTGFSNFDRIWRVRPDIVKLDRSLVARMAIPGADHQFATQLVTMLHQAGTMVLGEGVETDDELLMLMQADVDFVQGFWLGQPHASPRTAAAAAPALIDAMWARYRTRASGTPGLPVDFSEFEEAVLAGARIFRATGDLAMAAQPTLARPFARRVFVVDAEGNQHQHSIAADTATEAERLSPLFPDTHSNWSRRAYFKQAVAAPGRVALMGPHYSLTEGKDCYTAAVAVEAGSQLHVFCVDFILDVPHPDDGERID